MPKLQLFIPSSNVLQEVGENKSPFSLMGIINTVSSDVAENENDIPELVTTFPWNVTTMWYTPAEEQGKVYRHKIELFNAVGEPVLHNVEQVFRGQGQFQAIVAHITGFPVKGEGNYRLTVSWRVEDNGDWNFAGDYIIQVEYNRIQKNS